MSIKVNTLWNLFGSASPMIAGVFTIPYIYSNIGLERIGLLTIVWALIGYFSIFDFGLGRAITQRIASAQNSISLSKQKLIGATGIVLTLLLGIIGATIAIVCIKSFGISWVNSSIELKSETTNSLLLASLAIPAITVTAGLRGLLEGLQYFKIINILKSLLGLLNFLGPAISILIFGPNLDIIVAFLVVSRYVNLAAHYIFVMRKIGEFQLRINFYECKKLIKFGGWMTLSNTIAPLMVIADRFLITTLLGAAIVAFYTIPAEFLIRFLLVPAAITTTLFPILANKLTSDDKSEAYALYKKFMLRIFILMGTICSIVFLIRQ